MDYAGAIKTENMDEEDWSKVEEYISDEIDVNDKNTIHEAINTIQNNELELSKSIKNLVELISKNKNIKSTATTTNNESENNNDKCDDFYKNKIEIKFNDGNHIIIQGDKNIYGYIIGTNGNNLKKLRDMYPRTNVEIPLKRDSSNIIKIEGDRSISVLFNILKRIIYNS